jgi:hypothetical protein
MTHFLGLMSCHRSQISDCDSANQIDLQLKQHIQGLISLVNNELHAWYPKYKAWTKKQQLSR